MRLKLITIWFLASTLAGCRVNADKDEGQSQYTTSWSKSIDDFTFELEYVKPEIIAKRIWNGHSQSGLDSLITEQKQNSTFLFRIRHQHIKDLLWYKVSTPEEYQERIYELSFNGSRMFELELGLARIAPISSIFENSYGLDDQLTFFVVFPSPISKPSDSLFFVWKDLEFQTGISKFQIPVDIIQ